MINSGSIGMPLHFGKLPVWLSDRMGNMGLVIVESVMENYGKDELLSKMSDPNWFQALGALMGMQWNSSGVTAVVLGSLKRKINPISKDIGIYICGGKGKYRFNSPNQINSLSHRNGLNNHELVKSCILTSKIDNNAVMDGYQLYQHYFILSNEGKWTSISQGMNKYSRRARRYHWHSESIKSFTENPHTAIVGEKGNPIINLVDSKANKARKNLLSLFKNQPINVLNEIRKTDLPNHHDIREADVNLTRLGSVLHLAYERGVDNIEDLVMMKGVGPRTLKSLTLASEVIHGDSSRFEDPSRFAFAVGGKDGMPHPIDTKSYDNTVDML